MTLYLLLGVGPNGQNFQKCSITIFPKGFDIAESESGLQICKFSKAKKLKGGWKF